MILSSRRDFNRTLIGLLGLAFVMAAPARAYADEKEGPGTGIMASEVASDISIIAETAEAKLSDAELIGSSFLVMESDGETVNIEQTRAKADAITGQGIRSRIVDFAKQYVGGRYRYGGTSLTSGVDCSGFVMKVYEHFGIYTGRDSRTQAAASRTISMAELQLGDLLFYSSGGRINHVAIYIGNGQIVHASNERTGITISSMYYRTPVKAGTFL